MIYRKKSSYSCVIEFFLCTTHIPDYWLFAFLSFLFLD